MVNYVYCISIYIIFSFVRLYIIDVIIIYKSYISNLIEKKTVINSGGVKIDIKPSALDKVRTSVIDGRRCIIIDVDDFKEPIFIAHYNDIIDGDSIKIYYIKDGVVNETKATKANKVKYLYNIKDDKLELFIYQDSSYKSYSALIDIISKETGVRSVLDNDMNQEYVKTSDDIE